MKKETSNSSLQGLFAKALLVKRNIVQQTLCVLRSASLSVFVFGVQAASEEIELFLRLNLQLEKKRDR